MNIMHYVSKELIYSEGGIPYYFIHIPKTGGKSVVASLNIPYDNHASAAVLKRWVGEENWSRSFSFAFVRNPWSMLVSWFFYHKNNPVYKNINFPEWIRNGMPNHWQINNKTDWHQGLVEDDPLNQLNFLKDEKNEICVDFIGRFESFQDDFDHMCNKLNLKNKNLKHVNKSKHQGYRSYYEPDMVKIVAERFADFIEEFKYEF